MAEVDGQVGQGAYGVEGGKVQNLQMVVCQIEPGKWILSGIIGFLWEFLAVWSMSYNEKAKY